MPIQRLVITDVRNISTATFEDLGTINIFFGKNGSGKTSVLEAIYLLGLGKSFRTTKLKPIINNQAEGCVVYGLISPEDGDVPVKIGVARTREGRSVNKVQGNIVKNAASLAEQMPMQVLNAESFLILSGGPTYRRRFLDGGVFHVEHQFHAAWLQTQRCLKQRNSLLREAQVDSRLLKSWTEELVAYSNSLNTLRRVYFESFRPVFFSFMDELVKFEGLDIEFYSGWDAQQDLTQILNERFYLDKKLGYTHSGPHRADLRVKINGLNAADILSRGQQKLVVTALKLAQASYLAKQTKKRSVFLVDDLPAELDEGFQKAICTILERENCQVFITSVNSADLTHYWASGSQIKVFHVEQGVISQVLY